MTSKFLTTGVRPLRIAMIAPPWLRVPPNGYGGVESMLAALIIGLQRLGVVIDLFGVGGSTVDCPVYSCYSDEQYKFMHTKFEESSVAAAGHLAFALNKIAEDGHYDVIHDHNMFVGPLVLHWATESTSMPPALHTIHGSFFTTADTMAKELPDYTPAWESFSRAHRTWVVGISNFQMKAAPSALRLRELPIVYNGIDLDQWQFRQDKEDYFLTLARLQPAKGIDVAARLCAESNYRLKIAGPVAELTNPDEIIQQVEKPSSPYQHIESFQYFKQKVWPIVKEHQSIEYLGSIEGDVKRQVVARAKALLLPITWDEPFGLAVVEALASGTPVVAMRRGAMPELIQHGKTGFLADDEKELKAYMKRVGDIDPSACRKAVEDRFSSEAMALSYLKRYKKIIAGDHMLP